MQQLEITTKVYKNAEKRQKLALNLNIVSRSIGEVKDKFGIIKTSDKIHPNVCELCKYKGQNNRSDECNWCLDKNEINQYYG